MAIPYCDKACARNPKSLALFLRPHPAFHRLPYVVPVTESWAGAWEQDYSFSGQCESESVTESWAGAWEQDYSFSGQCESESVTESWAGAWEQDYSFSGQCESESVTESWAGAWEQDYSFSGQCESESVTESWVGAWEQDYSFSGQCESESCLPMITAKKRSPSICCFVAGAMCTKLRTICDHYLTEST